MKNNLIKYWWILPAIIAFSGMIASTFPSVEFTRNSQYIFLVISIVAAFGWFTRKKDQTEKQKIKDVDPGIIDSLENNSDE